MFAHKEREPTFTLAYLFLACYCREQSLCSIDEDEELKMALSILLMLAGVFITNIF